MTIRNDMEIIFRAIKSNNARIQSMLERNDALINEKDNFGNTLLHLACVRIKDDLELIALLRLKGINTNAKNKDNKAAQEYYKYD